MLNLLLQLTLSAIPARAGVACESVSAVEAKVAACSENTRAVESAQACYDKIIHAWDTAPEGLKKVMSLSKARAQSRQEVEFQFTHSDYEKTLDKIDELLVMTEKNTELLTKYSTAMLRDFHIEEAAGEPLPCYAENFAKLKKIVWALDDRIAEGEATYEKAEQLRNIALGRDGGLDTADTNGLVSGVNVGSGQSENGRSDVTGMKEDKAKRSGQKDILAEQNERARKEFTQWEIWREKEAEKLHSYLASPEIKAAQAERESTVTKGEVLEVFSRAGETRDFGAEISSRAGGRAPASVNNETAQREAASVGAFLFQEGGPGQSSVKLDLKEDSSAPAAVKPLGVLAEGEALASAEAGDNSYDPSDLAFETKKGSSLGEKLRIARGSLNELLGGKQGAQEARSPDVSLFSAVSDRYRRTELFRKARVIQVPLGSFEARLER